MTVIAAAMKGDLFDIPSLRATVSRNIDNLITLLSVASAKCERSYQPMSNAFEQCVIFFGNLLKNEIEILNLEES